MAEAYVVSVRELAEFACESGSLVAGTAMQRRMREGREGHQAVQRALPEGWRAEVPASLDVEIEGVMLRVQGRADALRIADDCVEICEIKTTRINPLEVCQDDYPAHWAQAEIYAHLFCMNTDCGRSEVTLLYRGTRGGEQRFRRRFTADELAKRFQDYARPYALWRGERERWRADAEPTLRNLRFPYPNYRDGQREMAKCVYRAFSQGGRALIEAPTGIGKTAASLYGALRALGAGKVSSVFYLTARTTGRRAAEDTLARMRAGGLKIRSVTITAKEKVCFLEKTDCGLCSYGDGYFDRRRDALRAAMAREVFGPEEIEALARDYEICPFELSLDLTQIADVVICDYNYVFDPRVRLKRHFEKKSRAGILVDEAHNLPDRAREMYSAELSGARVGDMWAQVASQYGERDPLARALAALTAALTAPDAEYDARREPPEAVARVAAEFAEQAERLRVCDERLTELMLDCGWFARVAKRFDEASYRALIRPEGAKDRIAVKLWCCMPERFIDRSFERVGGAALFSATLAPMEFYAGQLAVTDRGRWLRLDSPFPRENLFVARLPVDVRFRERDASMERVVCAIHAMAEAHPGNYLACFPSHTYLTQAYRYYRARFPDARAVCQDARMSEARRRQFIEGFEAGPKTSMTAFIALGGVFSEGIDLPDDRLSGAAIVTTGIPQVNPEAELLRELCDDGFEGGTDAAYTYPGFRRVLQAAGRVIRTETDRGIVLLIDKRYDAEKYLELMPPHWQVRRVTSLSSLKRWLHSFWDGENG